MPEDVLFPTLVVSVVYILSCVCVRMWVCVFEKKKTLSPSNLMLKCVFPSEPFTSA